ncbi:MAG: glycosyltransferase family 4 protein [Rikenellaceae bacterium]
MKITILGPAHPYRGGLAAIMQSIAREYSRRGDEVLIRTFTLQYPEFLFPGESQTVDSDPPQDLSIVRCVNTMNPLNWIKVGLKIRSDAPDILLLKYWTPFMAPCFGTIARVAASNGHTKVICQIDNVEPHEHHIIDRPFNRYFLRSVDGFIYMSDQVYNELKAYSSAPALFSPHPMFENFGARVSKEAACEALKLDPSQRYALFFGLIRDYKGLDILFDAWAQLKAKGVIANKKLIVAGEFYTAKERYYDQIKRLAVGDDIIMHDHFIDDSNVANYFSLSDFVVLPYHTASQSGVTQIAYNFCTPMIVTRVGGLPEIVPDGRVGYLCDPTSESVAEAIEKIWQPNIVEQFGVNIIEERKRFSWGAMCDKIISLYHLLLH